MLDLSGFRDRVRAARRSAGRTQQQLAREIGLHPHVLSHKLNGAPGTVLNGREAVAIVIVLARWGGVATRRDAESMLQLAAVPASVVAAQRWDLSPLADLPSGGEAAQPADRPWWAAEHVPNLRPAPLPEPVTRLVGREDEVAAVIETLREDRLVTLLGAGGTGKTRLALQVAKMVGPQFPDGVAFADLAPLTSPDLVADGLLRALGLAPEAGGVTEDLLLRALRPARVLLVVDNLEHLVSGAALLSRLLAAALGLRVLVTSRVVLQLYGEQQIRVRPLPLPADGDATSGNDMRASDAVELFCQRARAVRPGFDPVGSELVAVVQICRVLDGLPLAIELAAARVRTFSPSVVLERLDGALAWLAGGPLDLPHRQRSLTSTLAWSEALLSAEQRRLFAHLGVFVGSFDAAGAAAVTHQTEDHVLQLLEQLEDQSLLEPADRDPVMEVPRFRLLEPIREYALTRLGGLTDLDQVRLEHLRHYRQAAQGMGPPRPGMDADPELYRLFLDQANIRAALTWAVTTSADEPEGVLEALALVTACGRMWSRRSLLAEGAAFLERLLDIEASTHTAPPRLRLAALVQGAEFSRSSNDIERTRRLAGEALLLGHQLDHPRATSRAHRLIGEVELAAGAPELAMEHFAQQLDLARRTGDPLLIGDAHNMLGQGYGRLGRLTEARTALLASLSETRAGGDMDAVGAVIGSLAEIAFLDGDLEESASLWAEDLRIHRRTRTFRGVAYGLEGCAVVEAARHRGRSALEFAAAAQRIRDAGGWVLPEPDRRELTAALAESVALTDDERRQAVVDGRRRDLDAIIADAIAITTSSSRAERSLGAFWPSYD